MQFKFGIVKKMVVGITLASSVTYATSAFFLLVLKEVFTFMPSWLFVLLTLLLGVFWTGLFGYFAARWLLKPLLSITLAAQETSTGNLNVKVLTYSSNDEMQALGDAFEQMLSQLRTIIAGIKDNSHLTDTHVKELQAAIAQATDQIEQMTNESETITSGAQIQAQSADRLYHDTEAFAAAADRMSKEAALARERALRMNRASRESEEVFQSLVGGMHQLTELNRESLIVVKQLSDYAHEIGNISNVVGDIADQTHLLALNASIEAARAGEEGRGFDVVAQAVKSLADESAKSVQNIRTLIQHVQEAVTRAVGHIQDQHDVSEREARNGEKFATAFQEVKEETERVAGIVESMTQDLQVQARKAIEQLNEARQVAQVADQIRLGAEQLYSVSQEQTAVMEEISASSDSLRSKSTELRNKADFFE